NDQNFGPFPNRNQAGTLFGLAAIVILACAQDDLRKRRKRWIVWVLALVLIGAAIILNSSRCGIAILMAGSAFWLGALAFRQRSPWRLALGISLFLLLLLLTALLLFGAQTLERFHLHDFGSTGIASNLRWQIFHDTFRLIRNSPWCGIGFGNFESIFAIFGWALSASAALSKKEPVDVDLISFCWVGTTCRGPVIGCRRPR